MANADDTYITIDAPNSAGQSSGELAAHGAGLNSAGPTSAPMAGQTSTIDDTAPAEVSRIDKLKAAGGRCQRGCYTCCSKCRKCSCRGVCEGMMLLVTLALITLLSIYTQWKFQDRNTKVTNSPPSLH